MIREKSPRDLYTIDTHGDASIPKILTKRAPKKLKSDEIINHRSSISAIVARKRPNDKVTNGIIQPKRQRTSYISHKELTRLQAIAGGQHDNLLGKIKDASVDPWDSTSNTEESLQDPRFSFLEKTKKKIIPNTIKKKPISLAASGNEVPAVDKPNGAYSYNPLVTDYIERLEFLGQKEIEAEKARLIAAEAEHAKLEAASKSGAEADEASARAQLSDREEDSVCEDLTDNNEDRKEKVQRAERKTQAQRNKIKRRKEQERISKMLLSIKKKNEQVYHAKKIALELDLRESKKQLETVNLKDENNSYDVLKLRKAKLGKFNLPEKDLELVLPDELQDSLRLLRPEGNLLKERYRNLLLRGILESRRPISFSKKPKRKITEKWTHKDFVLH